MFIYKCKIYTRCMLPLAGTDAKPSGVRGYGRGGAAAGEGFPSGALREDPFQGPARGVCHQLQVLLVDFPFIQPVFWHTPSNNIPIQYYNTAW